MLILVIYSLADRFIDYVISEKQNPTYTALTMKPIDMIPFPGIIIHLKMFQNNNVCRLSSVPVPKETPRRSLRYQSYINGEWVSGEDGKTFTGMIVK